MKNFCNRGWGVWASLLILFTMCNEPKQKIDCPPLLTYQQFQSLEKDDSYKYIKSIVDENCGIDSNLTHVFVIKCIGKEDKYFFRVHSNCCDRANTYNEIGYCNGYLAEHYFKTSRFELAADTYGEVLSLFLREINTAGKDSIVANFARLSRNDQNLFLTCLYSRANSFDKLGNTEKCKNDLQLGLLLSRKVNPIFIDSFEGGVK